MAFSIKETLDELLSGKVTSAALVKNSIESFNKDKESEKPLNAFMEMYDDAVLKAENADKEIAEAKAKGDAALKELFTKKPLLGLPFGVKDNISVKGKRLTCASKILEGYVAPYDATVIARLEKAGAIPVGRCNQDEFAMGSSTEYSCYGPTRNPVNRDYVSGGSSGGPAACVSANQVLFSLGTETGGSVRLPASYCGIYGLKPTYGALSRWGVVAYGSSLDQVGLFGHTPDDIAKCLSVMTGVDMYDDTSAEFPGSEKFFDLKEYSDSEVSGLKIAIPKQFLESKGLSSDVGKVFDDVQDWLKSKGAKIDVVDLPILDASIASYYVIALAEAASNLSRFDGVRYGRRVDNGTGYDELYVNTRSEGFGPEVKRRIVIGNYVLSEQFSGDTYKKGMTVRAKIQSEMAKLYETYDIVIAPTCPTAAFKLGQKVDSPLEMYLSDLFTTFVNLARIPSISVPAGKTSEANGSMPVGIQFIAAMFAEEKILRLAKAWEKDHPNCGCPIK